MPDFKREERYIVIKRKHLDQLGEHFIRRILAEHDIPTIECAVVEADWPNYEHVWRTIQAVAEGRWPETVSVVSNPPDAYAVIEHTGQIGYTVMVDQFGDGDQGIELARQFCHDHINDCCGNGIEGAGQWVVRPLLIVKPEDRIQKPGEET